MWKGLLWCSGLLHAELRWEVRNGRTALFWIDSRVDDKPLIDCCILPVGKSEKEASVRRYWEEDAGWRWSAFINWLPAYSLLQVASKSIEHDSIDPDIFGWLEV